MRFSLTYEPLREAAARWVHPAIPPDSAEYDRQVTSCARAALSGMMAATTLPVALVAFRDFQHMQIIAVAGAILPFLYLFVVRLSGQNATAKYLMLIALAVTAGSACALTGGLASPFLFLLAVCLLEPVLWRVPRPFAIGFGLVLSAMMAGAITSALATPVTASQITHAAAAILILIYALRVAVSLLTWRKIVAASENHSNNKLQSLLSQCRAGFLTRHDHEGNTIFASQSSQQVAGTRPEALCGRGFVERLHVQDRVKFLHGLSQAVHSGEPQSVPIRIRSGRKDGSWIELDLKLVAASDDDAACPTAVGFAVPRRAHQAVQSSPQAPSENVLADSQKQFLAVVSHELRTPLNSIIGFSEILKSELLGSFEHRHQRDYAGHIHDSGRHLLNIVNDLLDVTRIEAGRYELLLSQFDASEMAISVIEMLHPVADKAGVTLAHDLSPSMPEIVADRRACRQILINLLSNAIKFTPAQASVRLTARSDDEHVSFTVVDEGIGMEPDFIRRIGRPFSQAVNGKDRDYDGVGLGMSIVKGLTALHGGSLSIESEPGSGTQITLTLPLKPALSKPVPHTETIQPIEAYRADTDEAPAIAGTIDSTSEGEEHERISA